MSGSISEEPRRLEMDLSEATIESLTSIDLHEIDELFIYLPLPSIGRTNMHIDICSDYIDASWAAERLAAASSTAKVSEDYLREWHESRLVLTLGKTLPAIRGALEESILLFKFGEEDEQRYSGIRDLVAEYEEAIDGCAPQLPEIVDDYFANLINGAYHQYRADAPDFYNVQIAKYPERQLGYYRSALSARLGADSYTSPDGWVVPISVEIDHFFEMTGQRYRSSEFVPGTLFSVNGASYGRVSDLIVHFPMRHYFKSRACASFAQRDDEDAWPWDLFEWREASFTYSPHDAWIASASGASQLSSSSQGSCFVHTSGTLVIVNDGAFRHFLYDTEPLNQTSLKKVHDELSALMLSVAPLLGLSPQMTCDWKKVSDEEFEELCYDVIFNHPKFDSDTIRKLGKSRSRDGGRDIEIYELPVGRGTMPKKWIFQCKLVKDGSSLSGRRLQDVGDMLDMYKAEGFGVMTSAVIDATLYDKLDAVCGNRRVAQLHFSRLELERTLARLPTIRERYFD